MAPSRQAREEGRRQARRIVLFWSGTEMPYGCFSQWYTKPDGHFVLDGETYFCAEQFMMATKARLFEDDDSLAEIMRERHSPKRIKELGRGVRDFNAGRWSEAAFGVVKAANLAKFGQNDRLRKVLVGTGDDLVAEASPFDKIWGIGLRADDPRAKDPATWAGENLLGKALMAVRDELKQDRPPAGLRAGGRRLGSRLQHDDLNTDHAGDADAAGKQRGGSIFGAFWSSSS
mmetsp:Transcript_9954/g.32478  ORF Transcript_9954/g.32478 Transcript_9954/m.32478 type:complete len:231 (+) Transcript_9954:131-823(+)